MRVKEGTTTRTIFNESRKMEEYTQKELNWYGLKGSLINEASVMGGEIPKVNVKGDRKRLCKKKRR